MGILSGICITSGEGQLFGPATFGLFGLGNARGTSCLDGEPGVVGSDGETPVPGRGVLKNLQVVANAGSTLKAGSEVLVATVVVNRTPTTLGCNLTETLGPSNFGARCHDTAHRVLVEPGDLVGVQITIESSTDFVNNVRATLQVGPRDFHPDIRQSTPANDTP